MEETKDKNEQVIENKKTKKVICIIVGILLILGVIGLCVFCYTKGMDDGKKMADKSYSLDIDEREKEEKNKKDEVSGSAIEITGEAVSAQAVSPDGVGAESTIEEDTMVGSMTVEGKSSNMQDSDSAKKNQNPSNRTNNNSKASNSVTGKLSVVGNQLMANGTPIQLRGVSTHGLSWFPDYVNAAMFGELKSWGANTVRLAMYTAEYNGYCTGDSANRTRLKELVKQGVQYATDQNMYVIIDWHILSDNNPNTYKSEAIAFFAEMADLYKDNDHVIYEICNEPNGGTGWGEIKSYANEVIATIRQRDPDGVILVGTPTWSQEVDKALADPITGYDNIMYTLHFYANTHRDSLRNTLAKAVEGGLPIFVSEFGICDASGNGGVNTQQADLWIQTLNQYGVSYVAWNLSNKAESSALIQSGCSKTSGITEGELSESGKWLLKTLQGSTANSSTSQGSGQNSEQSQSSNQLTNQSDNANSQPSNQNNSQNNTNQQQQKSPDQYTPQVSNGVEVKVVNSWQEGNAFCIQYEIKITNTTSAQMEGWSATMTFPANATVSSGWNANFAVNGKTVTFTNMDYNKTIPSGGKVEGIGCIIRFE